MPFNEANVVSSPILPVKIAGRYYMSPLSESNTAAALTADQLYLIPGVIVSEANATFDQIKIIVTVAGAGSTEARLGVYDSNLNLVLDAGTTAVDTATDKEISINLQLDQGSYWYALVTNGTPTIRFGNWERLGFLFGSDDVDTNSTIYFTKSFTYAALEASLDISDFTSNEDSSGPSIGLRAS